MTGRTQAEARDGKRKSEFVGSLAHGLSVLQAFDGGHGEMALVEVARRSGLSPATARRSLLTLIELGYARLVDKRYVLTPNVLALGSAYLRASRVDEAFTPELKRIVETFGDAASVTVLEGTSILYVAHVSQQRMSRMTAGVGVTYPAQLTSMGRVLLAHLPEFQLDRFFAEFRAMKPTARTIDDPNELRAEIARARDSGYAVAIDQLDYGVAAIAAPIRDPQGEVVAAINSSGYSGTLTRKAMIEERLPKLRASAAALTQVLRRYPALLHSLRPLWPQANAATGSAVSMPAPASSGGASSAARRASSKKAAYRSPIGTP
ncbi:MAG TPA: IclR family transcriptional regulator C-terminal domain-containing protein [Roseiarcus sp.]|nr:IclR family transcriptional regulator C-terminal domain-containing protein [Roseiarcus sp.]